jgi:hypothetical protein
LLGDELPVLTYLKKCVCSYLDDILIFSTTEEEHYAHFPRLCHGLDGMVSQQKCDFLKAELKLLGSIVSAYEAFGGYHEDRIKVCLVQRPGSL